MMIFTTIIASVAAPVDWFILGMGVFGGLALFLLGMTYLTDALKKVAGKRMKGLIGRFTRNRFKAAFTGAAVTAMIQSSSVTTVLIVGFISAGLLSLSQSIGMIMGANIGSTVTAQIIAFKITHYGLLMVAFGFLVQSLVKKQILKNLGTVILGLGLIFFGMELMSNATRPLRAYEPFIDLMKQMDAAVLGIMVGAIFTAVIQSSAATTGIVIVLASQGYINLEGGIAIALGANIGTCVTALLAALGKPREAFQAAFVHIGFNILGVLLWIGLIDHLAEMVRWLSPVSSLTDQVSKAAAEAPRQIANAHTLFNVINTFLFIGFTRPLARIVEKLLPIKQDSDTQLSEPKFLDAVYLETPDMALDRVQLETVRLGHFTIDMLRLLPTALLRGNRDDLEKVKKMDDRIDYLHAKILDYIGKISEESITADQVNQVRYAITQAQYIENIGDTIETNLISLGMERDAAGEKMSDEMINDLKPLFGIIYQLTEYAFQSYASNNTNLAREVINAKKEVTQYAQDAVNSLSKRIGGRDARRLELFRIESDIIENMKRIYYFAKKISREVDAYAKDLKE